MSQTQTKEYILSVINGTQMIFASNFVFFFVRRKIATVAEYESHLRMENEKQ